MKKVWLVILMILLACPVAGVYAVAAEVPRLEVVLPDRAVRPGEKITAAVTLRNNPGIAAIGFHVDYDKTRLELIGYEDALLTGWLVGVGAGENAVWASSSEWSGNGDCIRLVFRVAENAKPGEISIGIGSAELFNLNEESVDAAVAPGTVTVADGQKQPGTAPTDDGGKTAEETVLPDGEAADAPPAQQEAPDTDENEEAFTHTDHIFADGECIVCGYKMPQESVPASSGEGTEAVAADADDTHGSKTVYYISAAVIVIGAVIFAARKRNR